MKDLNFKPDQRPKDLIENCFANQFYSIMDKIPSSFTYENFGEEGC